MKRNESKTPFPQANSLELVYRIIFDITTNGIEANEIAQKYSIDHRQGNYYLDALCFIGLAEKIDKKYFLSNKGKLIQICPKKTAENLFINSLLDNSFIRSIYNYSLEQNNEKRIKNYISDCIYNIYDLAISTANRRASTIYSWICWIMEQKRNNNA